MYTSKRARSYRERKEAAGKRARRIILVIFLFIFYLFFSIYVSTPLKVETRSMEPSLHPSDRILFSRVSLKAQTMFDQFSFWGLERGDLVVVQPPFYRQNQGFLDLVNPFVRFFTFQKIQFSSYSRPEWEVPYMVKRIIGLPGDTVRVENFQVYITLKGEDREVSEFDLITADYKVVNPLLPVGWAEGMPFDGTMEPMTLGKGEFFLLSDSRGIGNDSLIWGGTKEDHILGKVLFRYFPFSLMTLL
jgi:signal peptidase I